ncbi:MULTISPECIES: DMT family transporter [Bacillaceae]|uniref:DMT family transporter n=1 Tax=Bacillaceae TaxID=186817 RepID=UPI001BDE925E|nr:MULTISPECIES: DMT family transporter [Bacillaceae]MDX8362812.1 DMT family transporter [Cytobacillus sp. IB215316]
MKGLLYSLAAGIFITLQGAFNARLSDDLGPWHTTSLIHLIGFIISFVIYLFVRDGQRGGFQKTPFLYLLGGTFGVMIVFGQMTAINLIGPTFAVAVLLIAQLFSAFIIETKGLFEEQKQRITWSKLLGIALMFCGVIVFKI